MGHLKSQFCRGRISNTPHLQRSFPVWAIKSSKLVVAITRNAISILPSHNLCVHSIFPSLQIRAVLNSEKSWQSLLPKVWDYTKSYHPSLFSIKVCQFCVHSTIKIFAHSMRQLNFLRRPRLIKLSHASQSASQILFRYLLHSWQKNVPIVWGHSSVRQKIYYLIWLRKVQEEKPNRL